MSTARRSILFYRGGLPVIDWLFRDAFSVDQDAPLTDPRLPEVGTVDLTQTQGYMDIVANSLLVWAGAVPSFAEQRYVFGAQTRAAGLALVTKFVHNAASADGFGIGFYSTATPAAPFGNLVAGMQLGGSNIAYENGNFVIGGFETLAVNEEHTLYSIPRPTAGFFLVIDNNLDWIGATGTTATLYPGWQNKQTNLHFNDLFAGTLISGVLATDYGIATNRVVSPTDGEVMVGTADGTNEVTWTPQAGETLELSLRYTDENNRYFLRCVQASNTIRPYKKESGVEAALGDAVAQTWTVGVPRRIVFKAVGLNLKSWVGTTDKNVVSATSFNLSTTGVKVAGSSSLSNLIAWPYTIAEPLELPADNTAYRYFAGFGDSKTAVGQYQPYLRQLLNAEVGAYAGIWDDIKGLGVSGNTVANFAGSISTILATITTTPEFILDNIGVNDVVALPAEATWKANMRTVWRAERTKWPTTPIYCADVWRRGEDADCATLNGWRAALIAEPEFTAYVSKLIDETVYLENGDDGVTYTSDGIHPNRAGTLLEAQEWFDNLP